MKQTIIVLIVVLALSFFVFMLGTAQIFAEEPISTLAQPATTNSLNLEQRVQKLEVVQAQTIESLKLNNDQSKFLIQMIGGLIAILVTIQGLTTFYQVRRERQRFEHQAEREKERYEYQIDREKQNDLQLATRESERDQVDRAGFQQVSKIMSVVQQTLESRLSAEEQARNEAKEAREELQNVLEQIKNLQLFYDNFQSTILKARRDLSEIASMWAKSVSRHNFKGMVKDLSGFAQQFDKFKNDFSSLDKSGEKFNARVPYIRGIAAHYNNQPQETKNYLIEVINYQSPEADEDDISYKRRKANAYYYLGLVEANFGNEKDAIAFFEKADELDTKKTDFLTKVVIAEAYIQNNNFDEAKKLIKIVKEELYRIEDRDGRLEHYHKRLKSRASLIEANMIILEKAENWANKAREILEEVYRADPEYYYATATLAQVHGFQEDEDTKQKLFNESYEIIQHSNHLLTVTEVRSKILLLMVAGLCCKHGIKNEKKSEEYCDKADDLRSTLPAVDGRICTVFSTLSKRNESSEKISDHIKQIRQGNFFL